jgi:hypothetical protein
MIIYDGSFDSESDSVAIEGQKTCTIELGLPLVGGNFIVFDTAIHRE